MTKFIGIVAATKDGVIGHADGIPWHIPEDLAHFRRVTMGQTVIMGRKTFESLPKPLDGREVIVIGKGYHSIGEAFDKILARDVVYIAGGKQIYELFLPFISEWYWTFISDRMYEYDYCDTKMDFSPSIERNQIDEVACFAQGRIWHITNGGKYISYDE